MKKMKESPGEKIGHAIIVFFVVAVSLTCLIPFLNTLVLSLSNKSQAAAGNVFLWPEGFTLASYKMLLKESGFFTAFKVSVLRVLVGGALNFVLTILLAYPLSKSPRVFKGRNIYMWILVFCMMFSAGMIPLYLTVSKLGLINSFWSLVLPGAVPIYNVILLMNFFRNISPGMEEAAIMDGANHMDILVKIFLPISLPCLATTTLFSVVNQWNAFFDGMIYINDPSKVPLMTYIQQLVIPTDTTNITDPNQLANIMQSSNKTLNAAKIVIAMIPILVIYPFLQRYFVTGITLGSVKE